MRYRIRSFIACIVAFSTTGIAVAGTLQVNGLSISYPDGLEAQAREAAEAASEVLLPLRAEFAALRTAMAEPQAVAGRIAGLLGAPEQAGTIADNLDHFSPMSQALEGLFSDWRIFRRSELVATGGLREGPVSIVYDAQSDKLTWEVSFGSDQRLTGRAFLLLIVNAEGEFCIGDDHGLEEHIAHSVEGLAGFSVAALHEVTECAMAVGLGLHHPYARWFNEGVSNWVAFQVGREYAPLLAVVFLSCCLPTDADQPVRGSMNLFSWPQKTYANQAIPQSGEGNERLLYAASTELIQQVLREQPPDALAEIIGRLKSTRNPSTKAICAAVQATTGVDCWELLLDYAPEDVRNGIREGRAPALYSEAKEKALRGDYSGAIDLLESAIEIGPSDPDAHLCLAWALRKVGGREEEAEGHVRMVVALLRSSGGGRVAPCAAEDTEMIYLLGRISQHAGQLSRARELFGAVLQRDPDHKAARSALAELDDQGAATGP